MREKPILTSNFTRLSWMIPRFVVSILATTVVSTTSLAQATNGPLEVLLCVINSPIMEQTSEDVVDANGEQSSIEEVPTSIAVDTEAEIEVVGSSSSQDNPQETEGTPVSNDENDPNRMSEELSAGKVLVNDEAEAAEEEDSLDPETDEEDPYPLRKGFNDDDTDAEPDELDIEIARLQALMKIDDPDMDDEPEVANVTIAFP